jgi:hypothetical protein
MGNFNDDDDDDDDSLYVPSHDGDDDIEWIPDFVDEPNEGVNEPSEEGDELSEEGDEPSEGDDVRHDNEQFQLEETKEDLQTPRFPKRANRGIHSQFYGFHTHIKKAIEEFGDPEIKDPNRIKLND